VAPDIRLSGRAVAASESMSSTQQLDRFLADYPDQVRDTARAARQFLAVKLPRAQESIDKSAGVIGFAYGPGYQGLVCTLIMSRTGVKLGVVRGAELPDPKHLLTGRGKVHRHVQLRSVADLRRAGLAQLLRDALAAWRSRHVADFSQSPERARHD
jgi:hypothetical protein